MFDEFDFGDEDVEDYRYIVPKGKKVFTVMYENAVRMAQELSPKILAGDRIHALVDGSFIFGDFIEAFMVENDLLARRMVISTLSMSKNNIDSLNNLIVGNYVEKLDIVVSDLFWETAKHKGNQKYVMEKLDINNTFQIAVADVHTKIVLIELSDGRKIVYHGSANLQSAKTLEIINIESDRDIFNFNLAFHDKILDKHAIIQKSIRGKKLWQVMQVNEKK